MRQLLARILLISDPHSMVIRPGMQRGQLIKGIDRIIEGRINQEKKRNNPTYFQLIRSFRDDQPYDCLIFLGDLLILGEYLLIHIAHYKKDFLIFSFSLFS